MKCLKIALITIVMSMLLVSCSKDKSTNPTNNGGDNNNNLPTTKITVITSLDGKQVDSREFNGTLDNYEPNGTNIVGYYLKSENTLGLSISQINNTELSFSFNIGAIIGTLENKNYSFNENDETYIGGSYFNDKISTENLTIGSIQLTISNVTYTGVEAAGIYYINGSMSVTLDGTDGQKSGYIVVVKFEEMPLSTTNVHI